MADDSLDAPEADFVIVFSETENLAELVLTEKIDTLFEHYGSQRDRRWFRPEVFTGLASVRGVQCHARYAEAFHLSKVVLGTDPGRVRAHAGQRAGEGNPTCACS